MRGLYSLALCVSITGLLVLDWRYRLAFFKHKRRTLFVLSITVVSFILWDVAGIVLGIFFTGNTKTLLGVGIGEFPIEEIGFLILLNYTSLVVYLGYKQRLGDG